MRKWSTFLIEDEQQKQGKWENRAPSWWKKKKNKTKETRQMEHLFGRATAISTTTKAD
jgi:hypothetical protein